MSCPICGDDMRVTKKKGETWVQCLRCGWQDEAKPLFMAFYHPLGYIRRVLNHVVSQITLFLYPKTVTWRYPFD